MHEVIGSAIRKKAEDISLSYSNRLLELIRAQVPVVNQELASSYIQHGYDFKTIPDSFLANASVIKGEDEYGNLTYKVHIPAASFTGASETLVAFFNQFVINNAMNLVKVLT